MKKVINGRLYDTEKAKLITSWANKFSISDFQYCEENLYRKRTGEYFLHGWGGPMSPYAESAGQNTWSGGEKIIPLTYDEAKAWMEEHADAEEYEYEFGIVDDGSEYDLHVIISKAAYQRIARAASEDGTTVRAIIELLAERL